MIFSEYQNVKISAIAASVPEQIMDIAKKLEDPAEDPKFIKQFMKNTGIHQRRRSSNEQTAADFSYTDKLSQLIFLSE